MLKLAVPVLHVSSSEQAESFYGTKLGFAQTFAYRPDEARADPCYMGFSRDGVLIHVSSFSGDGVSGGVAVLFVGDVDALHRELVAKGVPIALEPTDQTWGNREMYVKDADGNSLRFTQIDAASFGGVGHPAVIAPRRLARDVAVGDVPRDGSVVALLGRAIAACAG